MRVAKTRGCDPSSQHKGVGALGVKRSGSWIWEKFLERDVKCIVSPPTLRKRWHGLLSWDLKPNGNDILTFTPGLWGSSWIQACRRLKAESDWWAPSWWPCWKQPTFPGSVGPKDMFSVVQTWTLREREARNHFKGLCPWLSVGSPRMSPHGANCQSRQSLVWRGLQWVMGGNGEPTLTQRISFPRSQPQVDARSNPCRTSPPHSPTTVTSEDTAEVLEPAGGRGEEEENSHLLTSAFQIPHLGQGEVGEARNFRFSWSPDFWLLHKDYTFVSEFGGRVYTFVAFKTY